jgi:hypothetical protein
MRNVPLALIVHPKQSLNPELERLEKIPYKFISANPAQSVLRIASFPGHLIHPS